MKKFFAFVALFLAAITLLGIHTANANAVVAEDEPGWNCYTMGNGICGVDTYIEATDAHGRGAVLPVANDGIVYVSWQDGTVTPAAYWQRMAAWRTCVDYASGGDASLQACDADYQNPGERFTY